MAKINYKKALPAVLITGAVGVGTGMIKSQLANMKNSTGQPLVDDKIFGAIEFIGGAYLQASSKAGSTTQLAGAALAASGARVLAANMAPGFIAGAGNPPSIASLPYPSMEEDYMSGAHDGQDEMDAFGPSVGAVAGDEDDEYGVSGHNDYDDDSMNGLPPSIA